MYENEPRPVAAAKEEKTGFTLFRADVCGCASNCVYPHEIRVTDEETLRQAVRQDYVCARFVSHVRSVSNYLDADCIGMDVDNDHTDESSDWVQPENILTKFPAVTVGIHFSRHHMRPKGNKAARPRFHVLFACAPEKSAQDCKALKEHLVRVFPYFDANATDAARFFFGTQDGDCEFHPGKITVNECLDMYYPEEADAGLPSYASGLKAVGSRIPEGERNTTLFRYALRLVNESGISDKTHNMFLERAMACETPLEEKELSHIWENALRYYDPGHKKTVTADEFDDIRTTFEPEDRTDVGQAELLADLFGNEIRYLTEMGYLHYNGVNWCESTPAARGVAQRLSKMQLKEAEKLLNDAGKALEESGAGKLLANCGKKAINYFNDVQNEAYSRYDFAQAYKAYALLRRKSSNISATMQEVQPYILIRHEDLDRDPLLLNCPEHSYDLTDGTDSGRAHRAEDLCTKVTAVEPGDQGMDLWQDCLNTVFCGDQELIGYVKRICGLACIGNVFREEMIIAYGEGSNGKSTFWNTVFRVLGGYARTISSDVLITGSKINMKNEFAELKSSRMVLAAELQEGVTLNTAIVKQLTSTDPIHAEKKFFPAFSFQPTHTLILYTNHLPEVRATDRGTWRRLIVVPFNADISGEAMILNYGDYLFNNAGPAVLKWIMEGAGEVIRNGYKIQIPECVRLAIECYRNNHDWFTEFMDACCEKEPTGMEKSGIFYDCYRDYCRNIGEMPRSTADFYDAVRSCGLKHVKKKDGSFILGVRIRDSSSAGEEIPC